MLVVLILLVVVQFCVIWYLIFREKKPQGIMEVTIDEYGKITYSLEVTENPDGFRYMKYVVFEVVAAE